LRTEAGSQDWASLAAESGGGTLTTQATAHSSSRSVFVEATRNALQDVLSQALSPDWQVQVAVEETAPLEVEASAFFGLLVTGTISGKAGLLLARADAALIARTFVGEPPQETPDFGDEQREAFEELLRQVFGLANTALKDRFDQVWIEIDRAVPVAEPSQRITLLATSDSRPSPVVFELWMSAELADSLIAADQAPSASDGPAPLPVTSDAQSQDVPADLSVLAGVEVEIMLRFGHRRLPLREITTFSSGAVVELDESVAEPVEVVVGDRVVARGEIVSVDGCYGVRITETSDLNLAEAAGNRPQA
jgi:flagellar motor switch protein FliN/FliY